jgi:hypothetical protein
MASIFPKYTYSAPSTTPSNIESELEQKCISPRSSTEDARLLHSNYEDRTVRIRSKRMQALHTSMLYLIILFLLFFTVFDRLKNESRSCKNPALELWSPVNNIVKYKTVTFKPYFIDPSPWTRGTKEEKDRLWESTYEFGISGISEKEASNLLNATLPAPNDPKTYMIQLEVFHNLHCLNMLRKSLYPEQYPEMVEYYSNGTINHNTLAALHMDHCLDALRQSTMCEADITPVIFVHNFFGRGVYPKLIATHTCRDFDAIVEWAKEREVKDYEAN